ncbi:hypothetical protein D3C81_645570 [compost metagenome]
MRGYDDFWVVEERVIGFRRFFLEHVEGSSCDDTLIDRFNQRQLVNNAATGAVDDAHAFLHDLKLRTGDHVLRFRCQWRMDGDEVGITDNIVHGGQLHA